MTTAFRAELEKLGAYCIARLRAGHECTSGLQAAEALRNELKTGPAATPEEPELALKGIPCGKRESERQNIKRLRAMDHEYRDIMKALERATSGKANETTSQLTFGLSTGTCALLLHYLRHAEPSSRDMQITTTQATKNLQSLPRVDNNNLGPSYGETFTGGELWIEVKKRDNRDDVWLERRIVAQRATGAVKLESRDGSRTEVLDLADFEWRWKSEAPMVEE
jgi:hypothetical protein